MDVQTVKPGPFLDAQNAADAFFKKLIDIVRTSPSRPKLFVVPVDAKDNFVKKVMSTRIDTPIFDDLLRPENLQQPGAPKDTVAVLLVSKYTNQDTFLASIARIRRMQNKRIVLFEIIETDHKETHRFRFQFQQNEFSIPFLSTASEGKTLKETNVFTLAVMEIVLQL